jgi:hypothetical protein
MLYNRRNNSPAGTPRALARPRCLLRRQKESRPLHKSASTKASVAITRGLVDHVQVKCLRTAAVVGLKSVPAPREVRSLQGLMHPGRRPKPRKSEAWKCGTHNCEVSQTSKLPANQLLAWNSTDHAGRLFRATRLQHDACADDCGAPCKLLLGEKFIPDEVQGSVIKTGAAWLNTRALPRS